MSRIPSFIRFLAAVALALSLSFASDRAAAIDPWVSHFEAPDGSAMPDRCLTDAVKQRIRDLEGATERLRLKIQRIEKASQETLDALYAARDPARRKALMDDFIQLEHWREVWVEYRRRLEAQLAYYKLLPPCSQVGRRGRWPGEVGAPPTSLGPFTPMDPAQVCVAPIAAELAKGHTDKLKEETDRIAAHRRTIENNVARIAELEARGQGGSAEARALKADVRSLLEAIAFAESVIEQSNRMLRQLMKSHPCPPDQRQGAAPIGKCEAGVLAQVNAARADPPAYGASLRSARGRFAAEARDFLSRQPPVAALAVEPRLMAAARAHADDLSSRDVVSHRGANGQGLLDRFRAQGMYVTLSAEVIAIRQDTPAGAVRALVIDEGHPGGPHRKDLFNGLFTMTGIACVRTRSHGQLVIIDLSNAPMT